MIKIGTGVLVPVLEEGNRVQLPTFSDVFLQEVFFYGRWHANDCYQKGIEAWILNLLLYLDELAKEFIPVVEQDVNLRFLHNMLYLEIVSHFPEEIN